MPAIGKPINSNSIWVSIDDPDNPDGTEKFIGQGTAVTFTESRETLSTDTKEMGAPARIRRHSTKIGSRSSGVIDVEALYIDSRSASADGVAELRNAIRNATVLRMYRREPQSDVLSRLDSPARFEKCEVLCTSSSHVFEKDSLGVVSASFVLTGAWEAA